MAYFKFAPAFVLIFILGPVVAEWACPDNLPRNRNNFYSVNDKTFVCYRFAIYPGMYFWHAQKECQRLFGKLAIIKDKETNDFVTRESRKYLLNSFWIGLTDQVTEGNFVWIDGSPASYTNWGGPHEGPNAVLESSDCTLLDNVFGGKWRTTQCTDDAYGVHHYYICQYDVVWKETAATPEN